MNIPPDKVDLLWQNALYAGCGMGRKEVPHYIKESCRILYILIRRWIDIDGGVIVLGDVQARDDIVQKYSEQVIAVATNSRYAQDENLPVSNIVLTAAFENLYRIGALRLAFGGATSTKDVRNRAYVLCDVPEFWEDPSTFADLL